MQDRISFHYVHVSLQLGQNSLCAADGDLTSRLLLSIHDLAIVNNECVSCSSLAQGPAQLLGEFGIGVGEEELQLRMSALVHNLCSRSAR